MRKIVSIVTEKPQSASLLKSIINEWPWDKKPTKEEPTDNKDNESSDAEDDKTPEIELKALDTFSGKLIQPAPNTARFVVRLPASSIRQLYFDKAGPENLVKSFDDESLAKFISNPSKTSTRKSNAEIQKMPNNFKFGDQLKGNSSANYAILLDVPVEILKKLEAAKSAGESGLNEARAVLTEALAHRHYVMVLNIAAASKIADKINVAGTDLDAISNALTPNILVAMPKKGEVKVIRDAIIDLHDGDSSTQDTPSNNDNDTEDKPATQSIPDKPKTVEQQFKGLLDALKDSDTKTFNKITQLLADIGQAADKKKKMAEILNLVDDSEGA